VNFTLIIPGLGSVDIVKCGVDLGGLSLSLRHTSCPCLFNESISFRRYRGKLPALIGCALYFFVLSTTPQRYQRPCFLRRISAPKGSYSSMCLINLAIGERIYSLVPAPLCPGLLVAQDQPRDYHAAGSQSLRTMQPSAPKEG
jgi:hypothetical protein